MTETEKPSLSPSVSTSVRLAWVLLLVVFGAIYLAALHTPPLLDDADASHAQAAAHMAESGDYVTLRVNGLRYLEKPPLPYWIVATLYRVIGENAFATRLPNALAVLGCAWIAWLWCRRAWGDRAALYAGLATLTACGPFLYTRFFIPEALLSFFLLVAMYCLLTGLESQRPGRFYVAWACLALATLTKGLIAPVFFFAAVIPLLLVSGQWRRWRQLKPYSGLLLYLLIAAPWHILASLRNPGQGHPTGNVPTIGNVHGFLYFYFLNEHVFRFLGMRYPHDYNKQSPVLYWVLQLVWIFPWSFFVPTALVVAWKTRHTWMQHIRRESGLTVDFYLDNAARVDAASYVLRLKFRSRSMWLLGIFTAFTLVFFAISTNQEYYTWPAWIPMIIMTVGTLASVEQAQEGQRQWGISRGWIVGAHVVFTIVGLAIAGTLGWGLWQSRALPFVDDVGSLLAHRGVADYTLSMSHIFDLTGPSFAALRLPAILAAAALLVGPLLGLILRLRGKNVAATISIGLTSAVFLVAAHIAFARFEPMLSSKQLADTILTKGTPADEFVIFGDQSDASSVVFYTHKFFGHPASLIMERCSQNNEGSSLLWGSCYTDAPDIFHTTEQLSAEWGHGPRHWLFAQDTNRAKAQQVLGDRLIPVQTIADKTLWTDRPL
jgi:4-amino-4-deoxy-L-arabinose transferase-like glycosyltransferase